MNKRQITDDVDGAVKKWQQLYELRGDRPQLTQPCTDLIVTLISNIENDRSSSWKQFNIDEAQRYAISILPNILHDILHRYRFNQTDRIISSWEVLHGISQALDKWCFIKKDL